MKLKIHLLYCFDLGIELDFQRTKVKDELTKEVKQYKIPSILYEPYGFSNPELSASFYKFGIGMLDFSFDSELTLDDCVDLSNNTRDVLIGKENILAYCQKLASKLTDQAQRYMTYRYDVITKVDEIFPVFVMNDPDIVYSEQFFQQNSDKIAGIITSEVKYPELSEYSLNTIVTNYGYYKDEAIYIRRYGALIKSPEYQSILDLIKLNYAQHWGLKSYVNILITELDKTRQDTKNMPHAYDFIKTMKTYTRFTKELIGFTQDKGAIVDSLADLSSISFIDGDWHLRTLHNNLRDIFRIESMYDRVNEYLDTIEEAYENVREAATTNFFMFMEVAFFFWMIVEIPTIIEDLGIICAVSWKVLLFLGALIVKFLPFL